MDGKPASRVMKHGLLLRYGALAAAAALAAVVAVYFALRPAPAGDLIEANGQVRGTEVTLSARIPGIAEVVAVREGQRVAKGDLIAQIAARELEARLAQARAQVAAADSLVAELEAQAKVLDITSGQAKLGARVAAGTASHEVHRASEALARATADISAAEAQAGQDRKAYERFEKLLGEGFVSRNYFDEVAARLRTSEARLAATRQAGEEARAARDKARAASGEVEIRESDVKRIAAERERVLVSRTAAASQVQAARARVAEIDAQLADTRIVAPAAGTVMAKLAEPGELVAAGRPIATLVNLEALFVRVYVAERHVGRIRLGAPARVSVDAYPGREFAGTVSEIAQQAEFTPKEVHMKDEREKLVYGVKLRIENPDGLLKPGMPADAAIRIDPDARR
jgi:HlyD family secretion protein